MADVKKSKIEMSINAQQRNSDKLKLTVTKKIKILNNRISIDQVEKAELEDYLKQI